MAGMWQQHFSYEEGCMNRVIFPLHCLYCSYTAAGEETHLASTSNDQQTTSSVHLDPFASPLTLHSVRSRQESPSPLHFTSWHSPQHPPPG